MDESFDLPVNYKGTDRAYSSRLIIQGYTHKFAVLVEETEVIYERDEEGEYRAIIANPDTQTGKTPERGLLEAIGNKIQSIVA
jgi:hypothetical protein